MRKAYLKNVYSERNVITDLETGEAKDIIRRDIKILVKDREQFFYLYSHILGIIDGFAAGSELNVLTIIMLRHITGAGVFASTKQAREDIAKTCKISIASVEKCIKSLSNVGILIPQQRGVYNIDPNYVWRGTAKDRDKQLTFLIEVQKEAQQEAVDIRTYNE